GAAGDAGTARALRVSLRRGDRLPGVPRRRRHAGRATPRSGLCWVRRRTPGDPAAHADARGFRTRRARRGGAPMSLFLWAVYPYVCLTLFFVVPFLRLRKRPFEYSTRASGIFGRRLLGVASLLMHWGIITLIVAHAIGLTGGVLGWGSWVGAFFWSGAVGGLAALAGSTLALIRRLSTP